MQLSHLASSCSQGALALLQGAFFALWKKRSSSKRNIIPPTCLWTDLFVCFSPFECQPREMPRTCILLKPGVSPNSPSPTVPIPQPVLPGATAEPAGTSLPKDGLVWNISPVSCVQRSCTSSSGLYVCWLPNFFFFFPFFNKYNHCRLVRENSTFSSRGFARIQRLRVYLFHRQRLAEFTDPSFSLLCTWTLSIPHF